MAKQRGIHQISGKVNNLCYYEQKYVRGGLIRRINEAMSLRLKQDPAFQRTREANSVFGMCSMFAATYFKMFGQGLKFMLIPSVQAKLTKKILELFKTTSSGTFGSDFNFNLEASIAIADTFNRFGKNFRCPLSPYFNPNYSSIELAEGGDVVIPANVAKEYVTKFNCMGLRYQVLTRISVNPPSFYADENKYVGGNYQRSTSLPHYDWFIGDGDLNINILWDSPTYDWPYILLLLSPLRRLEDNTYEPDKGGAFYYLMAYES